MSIGAGCNADRAEERKIDNLTAEQINTAVDVGLEYAHAKGVPLSIERVGLELVISRQGLLNYLKSHTDDSNWDDATRARMEALKRMYVLSNCDVVEAMFLARNPAAYIFWCKVNCGYEDRVQHDVTVNVPVFTGEDDILD